MILRHHDQKGLQGSEAGGCHMQHALGVQYAMQQQRVLGITAPSCHAWALDFMGVRGLCSRVALWDAWMWMGSGTA